MIEENTSLKKKTITSLLWKFAERIGAQGVKLVVSLIIARLVLPKDYGIIALVSVFITILNVFVDSGLGTALIQKENTDDLDFSSVFYFNVVMCSLLYIIMFLSAPVIAKFYNNESLVPVVRVLSITIIISGLKDVQRAYVSRKLIFKKFFFSTLGGTLGAAVVGIVLAYKGYGVWALVAQQLFNLAVDTFVLWITVKWRPLWKFSFSRLKMLFSYGWKLLVSTLLNTVYMDIRSLIIGKKYSSSDLGFFNKGKELPNFIVTNVNSSIDSVLLPVMSKVQNEKERMKYMTQTSIMVSSFIMWPLMAGLAATGKTLIPLLLTDKWNFCIPYLYIFCFTYGTEPLTTANLNAIKAIGRSDLILRMEIIKKITGIIMIFGAMHFGVFAIALTEILYNFFAIVVNTYPNKKLLNYSLWEMIKDIFPSFLIALIMFGFVYALNWLPFDMIWIFLLQIVVGMVVYFLFSWIFKLKVFYYLLSIIKNIIHSKTK